MNETEGGKKVTPMRAIRAKCLDCMLGSAQEVALCPSRSCPLWGFRFGKNPNIRLSDEERERRSRQARENMAFTQQTKSAQVYSQEDVADE